MGARRWDSDSNHPDFDANPSRDAFSNRMVLDSGGRRVRPRLGRISQRQREADFDSLGPGHARSATITIPCQRIRPSVAANWVAEIWDVREISGGATGRGFRTHWILVEFRCPEPAD